MKLQFSLIKQLLPPRHPVFSSIHAWGFHLTLLCVLIEREQAVLRNNKDLFTQQSQMEASSMARRESWMTRREELLYQRELKFYVKRDREESTRTWCSGRARSSCGSLGSMDSKVSIGSSGGSWSSQDSWSSRVPQFLTPNQSKLNALKVKVLVNIYSAINRNNWICQIGKYLKTSNGLVFVFGLSFSLSFCWSGHVSWLNVW